MSNLTSNDRLPSGVGKVVKTENDYRLFFRSFHIPHGFFFSFSHRVYLSRF